MRKLTVFFAVVVLCNITNASAQNAPVTDCDRLAAHPFDPQRKAPGVSRINANMAIPACETAVSQYPNNARLNYQLGRAYYSTGGNIRGAFEQFTEAAERGYAAAQNALGVLYHQGQGVPRDDARAVVWYRKAAEQGFARAQFALGNMYEIGMGVRRDYTEAAGWYGKAGEQGIKEAGDRLGTMYAEGHLRRDAPVADVQGEWQKLPPNEYACIDQALRNEGVPMALSAEGLGFRARACASNKSYLSQCARSSPGRD